MEIIFDKEYLRQLYEEGKTTDKKHRFQPHIIALPATYQSTGASRKYRGTLCYPLSSLRSIERRQSGYLLYPGE